MSVFLIGILSNIFRLMSRYLNMEIELIRANKRSEIVERKLKEKTDELDATRKELASVKRQLEKLNRLPIIYSESLKVIIISSRIIS